MKIKYLSNLNKKQKRLVDLISIFALNKNANIEIKEGNLNISMLIHALADCPEYLHLILAIILKGKPVSIGDQKKLVQACISN